MIELMSDNQRFSYAILFLSITIPNNLWFVIYLKVPSLFIYIVK
jgi:hypothetical protein